jgi:tetratricopeptide (TPR) repeat protein
MESADRDTVEVCESFQLDLSCLVDGELDSAAADRAMVHLEECAECRAFFEETRRCLELHLDMADPDRMLARLTLLTGFDAGREARAIELVQQLAAILYQLGKAYVLAGTKAGAATRVFEAAVPVEPTQTQGRGFVDGVIAGGEGALGGVDWTRARGMLNGQLKKIASPLEKGKKLLEEVLAVDPTHEEARLYLAFVHAHEGRTIKASEAFREIFRTAIDDNNRGHAALQLGLLHGSQGDYRRALACFRWVTASGLPSRDARFCVAHFDVGLYYALLGDDERALAAFRKLIDHHQDRLPELSKLFAEERSLQTVLENRPNFALALANCCPELLGDAPPGADAGADFGGIA